MKMFKILSPAYHRYGKNKNMLDRLVLHAKPPTRAYTLFVPCKIYITIYLLVTFFLIIQQKYSKTAQPHRFPTFCPQCFFNNDLWHRLYSTKCVRI